MYNDLIDCMHDKMLSRGEVFSDEYAAEFMADYESSLRGFRLELAQLRACLDTAIERFVDSMVQNEYDTEQSEDETDKRVAHWESMRPRHARRRMILATLQRHNG